MNQIQKPHFLTPTDVASVARKEDTSRCCENWTWIKMPSYPAMVSEVEDTLHRIKEYNKSVVGVVVTNSEGVILRSTLNEDSGYYASVVSQVVEKARSALKDNDELTFVKIRTKKTEFIVVPDKDYLLITLINPSNESNA